MLALVRTPSTSTTLSCLGASGARRLASTKVTTAEQYKEYKSWRDGRGMQYKHPRPKNWLGGDHPFPLNPTFKPSPPISNALKNVVYQKYMQDPVKNDVRILSSQYNLSIKRVDAILRLKGLEQHWKQGKTLQTGFQAGMEELLAVMDETIGRTSSELVDDAIAADEQADDNANNAARNRYQRMFWEPTAENTDPVIPEILETLKQRTVQRRASSKSVKVHVVEREGRANIQFVDVGHQFMDKKAEQKRVREAERRSQTRARRQTRKAEALSTAT
ncbi:hypothetical protein BDW22DRAFT_1479855 [Trametopsis cervina]|nr:hypothetical protein BDW22DRAFT_1479855 [Trametopsis cervina]